MNRVQKPLPTKAHIQHPTQDRDAKAAHKLNAPVQRAPIDPSQLTPTQVIDLQHTIGNHATQKLIGKTAAPEVQRLPNVKVVEQNLKDPDKKSSKKERRAYKALRGALSKYTKFVGKVTASAATLTRLLDCYNVIEMRLSHYIGILVEADGEGKEKEKEKEKGEGKAENTPRKNYLEGLLRETRAERALVFMLNTRKQLPTSKASTQTWHELITATQANPTIISNAQFIRPAGGGTNVLDVVNVGGEEKYFKGNVDAIPMTVLAMAIGDETHTGAIEKLKGTGFESKDFTVLNNLESSAAAAGIIPDYEAFLKTWPSDERVQEVLEEVGRVREGGIDLAKRDIATSRLNDLLGAGVIVRAEQALRDNGENTSEGVLMDAAQGRQSDHLNFGESASPDTVNIHDPDLQRLLSRLQIIDALAGQVDRNPGNFFIQTDESGNVIGLTGIDNDMAFGTRKTLNRIQEFPGMSQYVDADLARTIIELNPEALRLALSDLLSDDEMGALLTRLGALKAYLGKLQSDHALLERDDWDEVTAQKIFKENKSYYANLVQKYEENLRNENLGREEGVEVTDIPLLADSDEESEAFVWKGIEKGKRYGKETDAPPSGVRRAEPHFRKRGDSSSDGEGKGEEYDLPPLLDTDKDTEEESEAPVTTPWQGAQHRPTKRPSRFF